MCRRDSASLGAVAKGVGEGLLLAVEEVGAYLTEGDTAVLLKITLAADTIITYLVLGLAFITAILMVKDRHGVDPITRVSSSKGFAMVHRGSGSHKGE